MTHAHWRPRRSDIAKLGLGSSGLATLDRVTKTPGDLSLLHFLQARLRQDVELILLDTPIFGIQVNQPEFERRFLDRAGLLHRARTELAIVTLAVEAMQAEQGSPPASTSSFEGGPVTDLGSDVLKLMAARYSDHSDYRTEWQPQVGFRGCSDPHAQRAQAAKRRSGPLSPKWRHRPGGWLRANQNAPSIPIR